MSPRFVPTLVLTLFSWSLFFVGCAPNRQTGDGDGVGGSGSSTAWLQVTIQVEGEPDSQSHQLIESSSPSVCSVYGEMIEAMSAAFGTYFEAMNELEEGLEAGTIDSAAYVQGDCEARKAMGSAVVEVEDFFVVGRSYALLTPDLWGQENLNSGEYDLLEVPLVPGDDDAPIDVPGRDVVGTYSGDWREVVGPSYLEGWAALDCSDLDGGLPDFDEDEGMQVWDLSEGLLSLDVSGVDSVSVSLPDGVLRLRGGSETKEFALSGDYPACAVTVQGYQMTSVGNKNGGEETDPPEPVG